MNSLIRWVKLHQPKNDIINLKSTLPARAR
jgi:hypothetical protein